MQPEIPSYFPSPEYWQSQASHLVTAKQNSCIFRTFFENLPTQSCSNKKSRIIAFSITAVAIIAALTTLFCCLAITLSSISITGLAVSLGMILSLLSGGAGILYWLIKKKKDLFTNQPLGSVWNRPCTFLRIVIPEATKNGNIFWSVYSGQSYVADLSHLDTSQTGIAVIYGWYAEKVKRFHRFKITVGGIIGTPLVAGACMFYYVIRTLVAPIYVLARLIQQKCCPSALSNNYRKFEISDIYKQCFLSICRAVKAPFFATAIIMALLFSLIDPLGGRILVNAAERSWSNDISREASYWNLRKNKFFQWEGGGLDPDKLGRNGFYLMGCMQPFGLLYFKNGTPVSGCNPRAIEHSQNPNDLDIVRIHVNNPEFTTDTKSLLILPSSHKENNPEKKP